MTPSAIDRAHRGAILLDRRQPDWWKKIDLRILNLRLSKLCILGQVYGDFFVGVDQLQLGWSSGPYCLIRQAMMGFRPFADLRLREFHIDAVHLYWAWYDEVYTRREMAAV